MRNRSRAIRDRTSTLRDVVNRELSRPTRPRICEPWMCKSSRRDFTAMWVNRELADHRYLEYLPLACSSHAMATLRPHRIGVSPSRSHREEPGALPGAVTLRHMDESETGEASHLKRLVLKGSIPFVPTLWRCGSPRIGRAGVLKKR